MRPLVRAATHAGRVKERATIRGAKAEKANAKNKGKGKADPKDDEVVEEQPEVQQPTPKAQPEKHFAKTSSSAPKRLNDIAQAPPTFTKVPKGATKDPTALMGDKAKGIVSMAQRVMMEKERERVVALYRELKAKRAAAGTTGDPRCVAFYPNLLTLIPFLDYLTIETHPIHLFLLLEDRSAFPMRILDHIGLPTVD